MKRIFLLPALAVLAILSSCSTSQTMLEVLQPSQIVLPEHITSIATVDRSKPEKGFANVVEGLFSGESIGQDREGRRRAQLGLTEALSRTPRFSVKTTSIEMSGSKNGANMMPPLPWSEIESICKRYDAQAVAAIESFDTNTDVAYSTSTTKHKEKDGTTTTKVSYTARRNLRVYVGWRLYDPKARVVQDETVISEFDEDTGYGSTQEAATKTCVACTTLPGNYPKRSAKNTACALLQSGLPSAARFIPRPKAAVRRLWNGPTAMCSPANGRKPPKSGKD
ncbi:MAG: hypothetical protein IPK21_14195 [Haliscomenobacter sp.]|nr:hypothetical protein [Haliscomenobacter sp.]